MAFFMAGVAASESSRFLLSTVLGVCLLPAGGTRSWLGGGRMSDILDDVLCVVPTNLYFDPCDLRL